MTSPQSPTSSNPVRAAEGQKTLSWLVDQLDQHRRSGHKIVTTNGCFDLLHPGHVALLEAAKKEGDVLVVLVNTDQSIQRLKGPLRPINNEDDRAALLLGLKAVDFVILFDSTLPIEVLEALKPDVHCKGGDYIADDLPESPTVKNAGGRVAILPLIEGYSSTRIIEKIRKQKDGVSQDSPDSIAKLTCKLSERSVEQISDGLIAGGDVLHHTAHQLSQPIKDVAALMATALANGSQILACGNGGSAADAQHFVAELVGRYRGERPAQRAITLTVDPSVVTCIGNDYGYSEVFARQVSAHGKKGDVLLAITTSGKSPNVLRAIEVAKELGVTTVALTGARPSPICEVADWTLQAPSVDTPLIQQAHIAIIHMLCELLELHISE